MATYSMNTARKGREALFRGQQDGQLDQCPGIVTRPAHHKLRAPPGSGQAHHPHVPLEPFVRYVWLLYLFWKGPFLGFRETGKVRNRYSLKNQP